MKNLADMVRENAVLNTRLALVTEAAEEYTRYWIGPPSSSSYKAQSKLKHALHESWALGVGNCDDVDYHVTLDPPE